MSLREAFNHSLDSLVGPRLRAFGRTWPTFQVCGYTGLVVAVLLAMSLVLYRGLSPLVMAAIVLAAVATFFGVAMLTKIVTGEETLTYYHHEIAVMLVAAGLLRLLGQPLLPYLDATLLGIGAFLVCGRVGCLMVGCCHGRPARWGVCYRHEHAAAGFTPCYVGVRLFPIQAVESLWVCCVVLVGVAMILGGGPPGAALAWYIVAYDIGRFCFEFVRGDADRAYRWGFSEAQWTSLALIVVVVGLGLAGALPLRAWHAGAAAGMALALVAVALVRRRRATPKHQLLHPRHVREIAEVIAALSAVDAVEQADPAVVQIASTSLGIQISAGTIEGAAGRIRHYAISCNEGVMTEETARTIAALICRLRHQDGSDELIGRSRGVFHLLVHPLGG